MTKQIKYIYNDKLPIVKKDWKGNICINGRFYNDSTPVKSPVNSVLKWKLSSNPQKEEKKNDTFKLKLVPLNDFTDTEDKIIWLGHASFLIRLDGVNIITDPCFFNIPTSKREVSLPCPIGAINNLDYLLISHDHRDHFDIPSIRELTKNNSNVEALLPLGMQKLFQKSTLNNSPFQEAGWYQSYKLSKEFQIIFLPANHWGRRGIFDFNKRLWGSFLLIGKNKKIFFAGDTAYHSNTFKEIQSEFGDIDICLLPIGAYSPKYIMEQSHTTPEEAFKIFEDLKGSTFIPMHYGTYDLSDEPLGEPIRRIEKCFEQQNEKLKTLAVGEQYKLESNPQK